MDMFPRKSVDYLRKKLSESDKNLGNLIGQLLMDPDGEEERPVDQPREDPGGVLSEDVEESPADLTMDVTAEHEEPRPGSSRELQVDQNEVLAELSDLFPGVSPIFLQEKARQLGDRAALQVFVTEALEGRVSLPSRRDWEETEERKKKEAHLRNLRPSDFLSEFEDPHAHYSNTSRAVSPGYKEYTKYWVMQKYARIVPGGVDKVNEVLIKNNNLLVPTMKELKQVSQTKGKKKTAAGNIPSKPKLKDLDFMKEYVFLKLEARVTTVKERKERKREQAVLKAREEGGLMSCPICYDDECLLSEMTQCTDGCLFCSDCVKRGAKVQIGENKSSISCLLSCGANIPLKVLEKLLPGLLFNKLVERQQMEEIKAAGLEGLVQCPACSFAIVITDPEVKIMVCGNKECGRETCRLCGEKSHVPLACDEVEKDEEVEARTRLEMAMSEAMIRECVRPGCGKKFYKIEGCNKMKCECGQSMCYLCRKPVEDNYKHFYGQGVSPVPGLCPLFSNNNQLHKKEVQEAADRVKSTQGGKRLKFDPTLIIKEEEEEEEEEEEDYSDAEGDDEEYSDDEVDGFGEYIEEDRRYWYDYPDLDDDED